MKTRIALLVPIVLLVVAPRQASAQLDPLLFLKQKQPNVVLMVDGQTANPVTVNLR